MIKIRFLDPKAHPDHPREFKNWKDFFDYLLNTWSYSDHNFYTGATAVSPGLFRFMTYAFGMVVTDTEVYNVWLLRKNSKVNLR